MILDNLTRALKTQNWIAAAVEFLIVVAGVVIGFQINAWNENRAEARLEQTYLGFLIEDLQADRAEFTGIRQTADGRNTALYAVLSLAAEHPFVERQVLPEGPLASPIVRLDALPDDISLIFTVLFLRTMDGNRHAYTTLINSGDMRLISDAALLRDIQRFYAEVDEFRDMETTLLNRRDALWATMQRAGLSRQTDLTVEQLADIVSSDLEMRAQFEDFLGQSARQGVMTRQFESRTASLIARLEEAIE